MEPEQEFSTTYTGHGCFVGFTYFVAVPMLMLSGYMALIGFPGGRPHDRLGGALVFGIGGLFGFLLGLGCSTFRVTLRNGILTQSGVFTRRQTFALTDIDKLELKNISGRSSRLEQILIYSGAQRIGLLSSFREYQAIRDLLLRSVRSDVIWDRRYAH